jgi:hypothetical protein
MKLSFKILLVSTALISFAGATAGFIAIVLAYEAPASADKPNVTDWMQGWGNVGGVVVGAGAAFAAALVYRQGQRALQDAEKRRLEDLADAAEAAKQAETRWKFERAAAEEAHDETVARMEKQIQGAERAARAMQSQFQLDRHRWIAEQEERRLEVARAVLVLLVRPDMSMAHELQGLRVQVWNYGHQPIRRVAARVHLLGENQQVLLRQSAVGPDQEALLKIEFRGSPIRVGKPVLPDWRLDLENNVYSVILRFTDAAGREWERTDNGEPTWLNPPSPSVDDLAFELESGYRRRRPFQDHLDG